MPSLGDVLKKQAKPQHTGSLWKGPIEDGITYSMLCGFLSCRERFRVKYVLGLRPADAFNHRIYYGNMWHVCEETYLNEQYSDLWPESLDGYCDELSKRWPMSREQIQHWKSVCQTQFPRYLKFYTDHPDDKPGKSLVQEKSFNVPYELPSGRTVRLRGKWDNVDVVQGKYIRVWDHKTKGDIDPVQLQRQLAFDLQTMLYVSALTHDTGIDEIEEAKLACTSMQGFASAGARSLASVQGIRYNVVRRPLSGGKGSIVRHKATKNHPEETHAAYYARLGAYIDEDPSYFFGRWDVMLTPADITTFMRRCLTPLLEQVCDWWEWVSRPDDDLGDLGPHWQHPFGVRNILDEGGSTDLDDYLMTGNPTGLVRADKLFGELE